MKTLILSLMALSQFIPQSQSADCPVNTGKYGNNIQYQDMFCRVLVNADRTGPETNRNITVNDDGMIQIFSNFPGTTNSNSTGARVFYLLPLKTKKKISPSSSDFKLTHPSGVVLKFDKDGRVSSDQIKMTVSKEINSKNKSGIEIESFSKGLVVDLGYRMGATPLTNKNTPVTITDKNNKKCSMLNSDLNIITPDKVELIYKTNHEMYKFLSKKCPGLDLSDFLTKEVPVVSNPLKDDIEKIIAPAVIGRAPATAEERGVNDSKRTDKPQFQDMDSLIESVQKKSQAK